MTDAHETLNSALITTIRKLHSGYLNGARVTFGKLEDFIKTSCLTSLTFFGNGEHGQGSHNAKKINSLYIKEKICS